MRTKLEFITDKFPPTDGEENLVNAGLWGKKLAEYLCQKLQESGIQTGTIYPEDWGWCIPILNVSYPIWIGCGHYEEYPNGYLVFVEPSKPVFWKFLKKIDITNEISKIIDALDKIISSDPEINSLRWIEENEN